MESTSGRSSVASKRHRSMVEVRTTPLSRISRPGSALDTILDRMGAIHADTRNAIEAIHADIGAVHADTRSSIEAIHADIGVHPNIDPVQAETREVLETVMHKLEHLETSPVPKFAAGLDLNPSHSGEMTAASYHSTIESEVVMGSGVLRRSERLLNKPKVDRLSPGSAPTKMAGIYCCEFGFWPNTDPQPILILRGPAATREPLSV